MTKKIKGTEIRCKNNLNDDAFDAVPASIDNYIELGLISGNDLIVWKKLLQLDNMELGYAYPTIEKLIVFTNLSRKTVNDCIKKLDNVGLIKKKKSPLFPNKNIYYVFMPLSKNEVYSQVPGLVKELAIKKEKYEKSAEKDKLRLHFRL